MSSEESRSTSELSNACLKWLYNICSLLHGNSERERQFDITYSAIYDEFARFKIWADSIGALQPDYSSISLAQRLKHAPRTADEILELLKDLEETLVDVHSIISEKQDNRTHEFDDLQSAQKSDVSSTEGTHVEPSTDEFPDELSEIQDLFQLVSELNTNLFRASGKIRSNTPRDRYVRAATALPDLKDQFAAWDHAHILNKYIKLRLQDDQNWLTDRLARAITWRRQYLRYCQNHSLKVSTIKIQRTPVQVIHIRQLPTLVVSESHDANSLVELPPPLSVTTLTTPSTFLEETPVPEMNHIKNTLNDEPEELVASTHATSVGTVEGESPAITRLEQVRKGNYEFICLFCTQPQKFRSNHAWKAHALEDLRPYICTFQECDLRLFPRRHDWFNHERQNHRVLWHCSFCHHSSPDVKGFMNTQPYPTEVAFESHLRVKHQDRFVESQLSILVADGKRPMDRIPALDCPFCDQFEENTRKLNPHIPKDEVVMVSWSQFRNHVGRHMKDLATFAIPRSSDNDEEDQGSAESGDSAKPALAIDDADLLKAAIAPHKNSRKSIPNFDDSQSTGCSSYLQDITEADFIIPDAPEDSFLGFDGLPAIGVPPNHGSETTRTQKQLFLSWMERNKAYSVFGVSTKTDKSFIPYHKVRQYFSQTVDYNSPLTRLEALLREIVHPSPTLIKTDFIYSESLSVLCILLCINHEDSLRDLVQFPEQFGPNGSISDKDLPLPSSSLRKHLSYAIWREDINKQFWKHQWQFCVPRLLPQTKDGRSFPHLISPLLSSAHYYDKNMIIPIVRMEELGSDSTLTTFSIWIHQSYNAFIDTSELLGDDSLNHFILKQYASSNDAPFCLGGFGWLSNSPGVLTYHGSFVQGGTWNSIIEFADRSNLEDYFENEAPPTEPQNIARFWHSIYLIIDGLHAILKYLSSEQVGGHQMFPFGTKSIFVVNNPERIRTKSRSKTPNSHEASPNYKHLFKLGGIYNVWQDSRYPTSSPSYKEPTEIQYVILLLDVLNEAAIWVTSGYSALQKHRALHEDRFKKGKKRPQTLMKTYGYLRSTQATTETYDVATSKILNIINGTAISIFESANASIDSLFVSLTRISLVAGDLLRGLPPNLRYPMAGLLEMERFQYQPLQDPTRDIRLFILLPGRAHEPIRINLHDAVYGKFDYEALSYQWGSNEHTREILIDAKVLIVTRNLYKALQALRDENDFRCFWVDAICINQADIEEHETLTVRLPEIFKLAKRVVMWLGNELDDSSLALETLDRIGGGIKVNWAASSADHVPSYQSSKSLKLSNQELNAAAKLLQRPYFTRIWRWKETRYANTISVVMAGRYMISLSHFRNAIWFLIWTRAFEVYDEARSVFQTVLGMVDPSTDTPLTTLIHQSRDTQCSDPRDKIYALLSLTKTPVKMVPDYGKSTLQVYGEVVKSLIFDLGDADILNCCELRPTGQDGWPSWVPNFSTRSKFLQPFTGLYAAGDTYQDAMPSTRKDSSILYLHGIDFDEVVEVFELQDLQTYNDIRQMVAVFLPLHAERALYVGGGNLLEAYFRTLCGNMFSDRYFPPRRSLLETSESTLTRFLHIQHGAGYHVLDEYMERYLREFRVMAEGRCLFTTKRGYIGLGVKAIEPGDEVYVFLGCKSPMILRDVQLGGLVIKGEAYIHGLTEGQAILGPLPEGISFAYKYSKDTNSFEASFIQQSTGISTPQDPRLGLLPVGWSMLQPPSEHRKGKFAYHDKEGVTSTLLGANSPNLDRDPRLSSEMLKARGVSIKEVRIT